MVTSIHISMYISNRVKEIRLKHNLSQHRFGQRIGVSGKSISAYETGRCLPPVRVLEDISKEYDAHFFQAKDNVKEELRKRLDEVRNSVEEIARFLR